MFLASHEGTVERLETLARSAGNAGMTAASKDKAMDKAMDKPMDKASAAPQGKSAPSADDGAAPAPGDGNANSTRTRN
jgi:hypothetical protein